MRQTGARHRGGRHREHRPLGVLWIALLQTGEALSRTHQCHVGWLSHRAARQELGRPAFLGLNSYVLPKKHSNERKPKVS